MQTIETTKPDRLSPDRALSEVLAQSASEGCDVVRFIDRIKVAKQSCCCLGITSAYKLGSAAKSLAQQVLLKTADSQPTDLSTETVETAQINPLSANEMEEAAPTTM